MKSSSIRNQFIQYFKTNDHVFVESSDLVPVNDSSLLFTNAGMVQFKNIFTGKENPKYKNIVTSQKCIRAGGKHNDLDNVGFTPRHHTFFEMLGNFSFGNYFKEKAIYYAWDLLTNVFSIDSKRLIITVYKGDKDSLNLWKKISGYGPSQIIEIASDDNFWSMGETGPCGPCSEIFFDNGEKVDGGLPGTKNQDGDRFVEIWNLVFMEYEKVEKKLSNLPKKCVDTGMGLERITAVLNGKINNFEIDFFEELINEIKSFTNVKKTPDNLISFRVVADHIRAITFLVNEGVVPSNEGRGYVLRRIIRRASRHLTLLGCEEIFLYKLVSFVCEKYGDFYYSLNNQKKFIIETLRQEEERFIQTLKDGLIILNQEITNLSGDDFPPEVAFRLYDTYGFPIDMTNNILKEKKLRIDMNKFHDLMDVQKKRSKESWKGVDNNEEKSFLEQLSKKFHPTIFSGYQKFNDKGTLLAIIENGVLVDTIFKSEKAILIFDQSPFYAELGGQIGDSGNIYKEKQKKKVCEVIDTQKEGDVYIHLVKDVNSRLSIGEKLVLKVNEKRRINIKNNHTATHLLHESLRIVLGNHIKQKGSLVSDKKLRFDFTNNGPLEYGQIDEIEKIINSVIRNNANVVTNLMDYKIAIKSGAIGLFGEKYPSKVRVVTIQDKRNHSSFLSKELCGGTHVENTGEIGSIKIMNESSVSSGVRRIEAVTGEELDKLNREQSRLLGELKDILKTSESNIVTKIKNIIIENHELKKKNIQDTKSKFDHSLLKTIKGTSIYTQIIDTSPKELKNFADQVKKQLKSVIIILVSSENNKVSIVVSVSDDLKSKFKANVLVKKLAIFFDGTGGGGREDLAQGGGNNLSKLPQLPKFLEKLFES